MASRLKVKGNEMPDDSTVERFYMRFVEVAKASDVPAEVAVGDVVGNALIALTATNLTADESVKQNATDAVMTVLAQFDAACKRIREELRGIHGIGY